jgi:hypothetical protein
LRHFTELELADVALKTVIEVIDDAHFLPFDKKMNSADDNLKKPRDCQAFHRVPQKSEYLPFIGFLIFIFAS